MADTGVVLSFPAILRNLGLKDRYAYLHAAPGTSGTPPKSQSQVLKKQRRNQNEGKRWVRRNDNARFVGNPHIVAATKRDYALLPAQTHPTFPEPLPPYLPRTLRVPAASIPTTDPASANAGRFSVSLKGMRRDLRRAGGRAEALVRDVESEIVQWLATGGTVLSPDTQNQCSEAHSQASETPVGNSGTIAEVSRTPLQLIWRIADDSFARYVVHCCARFHEVVSFSKGTDESRLTYLLRPNVTRPDRRMPAGLDTPPVTDLDYSSNPDTDIDSDFISERELESDVEADHCTTTNNTLAIIVETPGPDSPTLQPVQEDPWSLVDEAAGGESDADEFDSGSELGSVLGASVDALEPQLRTLFLHSEAANPASIEESTTLPNHPIEEAEDDPDQMMTEIRPNALYGAASPRRREWASARSPSSPSRSPVRPRPPRRRAGAKKRAVIGLQNGRSFYDYLFL
ncbi:unnamed protein product [Cyclocybe aegerita]|uniref:Uncharacterized protein n=1 Tax=Cyclocybe aegerita TaxID=1973307 RepID=A0A8S0XP95_CYCAE|nr:unnamed protein product [Cyclocybe aegerita]